MTHTPIGDNAITFTHAKRDELRKLYNRAVKDGANEFQFEGRATHTGYAKYLLEYLDTRLGRTPR